VIAPVKSLTMNRSCVPAVPLWSVSSRTTVPSAVTSTLERWFWKSATIAELSGCADAPHAASQTALRNSARAQPEPRFRGFSLG